MHQSVNSGITEDIVSEEAQEQRNQVDPVFFPAPQLGQNSLHWAQGNLMTIVGKIWSETPGWAGSVICQ